MLILSPLTSHYKKQLLKTILYSGKAPGFDNSKNTDFDERYRLGARVTRSLEFNYFHAYASRTTSCSFTGARCQ